ncbi:hypothetical protein HY628_00540 [Candidatus Uhrbacteria bacterium]|nr:hypothetical protein [Candidatus Uhrbacteria bacterium]
MSDRIHLTDEQIRRVVRHLKKLTVREREEICAALNRLQSFGIGQEELHRELLRLRGQYAISESDMRLVERRLFGESGADRI